MAAFLTLVPMTAAAETATKPRVVLVTNHADAAIVPLLRAELDRMGFDVVLVDHGANEVVPQDLRRAARDSAAVAGFRVLVSNGTVEVWITDRMTGKIALREILPQGSDPGVPEHLVVTRSIELLRASLLELQSPEPPLGEVPVPAVVARLATYPRPPARTTATFGVGYLTSVPGAGDGTALHTILPSVGLRYAFRPTWSVGVSGAASVSDTTVATTGGETAFSSRVLGGDVRYERFVTGDWLHVAVGGGVAALLSKAQGRPATGYVGDEKVSAAPAPYLVATLGVLATSSLRLELQATAALSLRPLALARDGETIARFGSPIVGAGLQAAFMP